MFANVRLVLNRADVSLVGCLVHEGVQLCGVGNGHLHQPACDVKIPVIFHCHIAFADLRDRVLGPQEEEQILLEGDFNLNLNLKF